MSSFKCEVYEIEVIPHPDADSLELAKIGEYLSVIPKNRYKNGDKVVYIPEQALLPDKIIEDLGLKGKLAGSSKNRVKALKLRGVLSQGLIYPAAPEFKVGEDVKDILGITKWEPPIPMNMSGEVGSWERSINFDIENFKKYPNIFQENEEVVITEKIHGTCNIATYIPEALKDLRKDDMVLGKWAVASKGLSAKRNYFKDNEKNKDNIYINSIDCSLRDKFEKEFKDSTELVSLMGETFGRVQDLKYGESNLSFRAFGIKVGNQFLDFNKFEAICQKLHIPMVPVLYKGPFSREKLKELTSGKEQVSGEENHIREGVVVIPATERNSLEIGRVILKSVSDEYLTRKDATEFN